MSNKDYLVSAIVSVYNCERFIRGCLEDLERQTIADKLEIVVVNSGSQQNEEAIIKEFQQKYDNIVYIKTEQRETIYAAWNRAIKASSGKYITNANSDDRHRKDALEIMVNVLESEKDVGLVYADYITTDTENETFEYHHPVLSKPLPEFDRYQLLLHSCVGPQPMWRKSIHKECGYFDENLKVAGDYEFWLRVADRYSFKHINKFLGLYLRSPESAQHRNFEVTQYEETHVRGKYMEMARSNKKMFKDIKKTQAKDLFDLGYVYFVSGHFSSAKKEFYQSLRLNQLSFKTYKCILLCFFPPQIVGFLRKINNQMNNIEGERCQK